MILLYMIVSCVLFGSSAGMSYEDKCYGSVLRLPFEYSPPFFKGRLYFTPKNQGVTKLLMDNGEAKDPRLKISTTSVRLTDLRDGDEGIFSVSISDSRRFDIIKLTILDCAEEIRRNYGGMYARDVPRQVEYLEFSPQRFVEPQVMWNRTDPQTNKGGRGQMKRNIWEISGLTQADSGYYNLRGKDNTLLSRIRLIVQENQIHYEVKMNERLVIQNPSGRAPWTVNFHPEDDMEDIILMKNGNLVIGSVEYPPRMGRIREVRGGIEIDPVQSMDAGSYEFRDQQGNLAQTVEVEVQPEVVPTFVYVAVTVGIIFAVIICCCCVRKCCCKKSSSKRNESAPAVYYHDKNQPAGPSHYAAPAPAHSYQPVNPHVSREPATTSNGSSMYNPVNIHVSPRQPEVAAPGGQGATPAPSVGSDFLSSEPVPTFELKGQTLTPLSSTSTFNDVYTSDKLNFL